MIAIWLIVHAVSQFAGGQPALQTSGEEFSPKGGKFTIRFPGKPKETTQNPKSPIGDVKVTTYTYATNEGNVYMVSYSDLPQPATKKENLKTLFEGVINGAKGKDGTLIKDVEFMIEDEIPYGHKLDLKKGDQAVKLWVVVREDRLFQIAAVGSSRFVEKDGKPFLESFQLSK